MNRKTYFCKKCGYKARRRWVGRHALCPHGHGYLDLERRPAKNPSFRAPRRNPSVFPVGVCATCGGPTRFRKTPKMGTRWFWELRECTTHPEHNVWDGR